MDIFSKEKRSKIMGRIGGKNTKPEIVVRSLLHKMGYRFRIHKKELPGKPDICLPKYNTVVFVHGCYWHRHKNCKRGCSTPSTNTDFWKKKFRGTVRRDKENQKALRNLGWNVVTVWQCELSDMSQLTNKLNQEIKTLAD